MKKFAASIFILSLLFVTAGCREPEPIKIGVLLSISGKTAQLGQSARDGVILAVEKINAQGGVKGRTIVLEYFDAAFDPNKAEEGVRQLHKKGVAAIVGPVASQMAVSMVPVANELRLPIISPTVTTPELSNKKDFFFRVYPDLVKTAQSLAAYTVNQKKLSKFLIIWDSANSAFTEPWKDAFVLTAEQRGASVPYIVEFDSRDSHLSHTHILQEIPREDIDGILFLASPMDTAMFCQQLQKLGSEAAIMGSDWSYTGTLVEFGGKSVEGFVFTTGVNMDSSEPAFLKFNKDYRQRFNADPNFPAVLAYETIKCLVKAMSEVEDMNSLADQLVNMKPAEGLLGPILLNEFGDSEQAVYINEVHDGTSEVLTQIQ